jgi:hypothetical protein
MEISMNFSSVVTFLFLGLFFVSPKSWGQDSVCENYVVLIKLDQIELENQNTILDPRPRIGSNLNSVLEILNGALFENIDAITIGQRMIGLFKPVGETQDILDAVKRLRLFKGLTIDCETDQYRPQPRLTGGN